MPKLAGRCLCGQVTYRIGTEEPLDGLTVCHCRQCNRWAGGPANYAVCRTSEIVVELFNMSDFGGRENRFGVQSIAVNQGGMTQTTVYRDLMARFKSRLRPYTTMGVL